MPEEIGARAPSAELVFGLRLLRISAAASLSSGRSLLPLVVLRFPFPERRWRQHSDGLKGIQDQQILIAGDNRGALSGERSRQHDIVIMVATSRRLEYVGRHEGDRLLEQPKGRSNIHGALTKFSSQDIAKLVEQRSRRNHDMVADTVLQKIPADAARDEGRDEDVRAEEQPHETRLNTSSSVKMPCA